MSSQNNENSSSSSHSILLVEDDESILLLYSAKFKSIGCDIALARNGQEGLDLAKEINPELILLDLMMPVMDGEEMLKKLRASDWGREIKVVILTNISKDEAPLSLRSLDVEDYLVKALFTPTQIAQRVINILNQ